MNKEIQNGEEASFFARREWSFTMADDIYVRYQSFLDKDEMMAKIQKMQPHKIDIGAVFTGCPKDHTTIKPELFKPVERELVFDIDMTDYDDVRTCCSGADICLKCWPFMTMAMKVLDCALRDDFAFRHILWVYSGRRGVHCWVCDPEARALPNEARAAIVDYLSVHTGTQENSDKKMKSSFQSLHPLLLRAYSQLLPYFITFIAEAEGGQGILSKKDKYMKILNSIPNESIRIDIYEYFEKNVNLTATQRWKIIEEFTTNNPTSTETLINTKKRAKVNYLELEQWRYELIFTYCYPRLDANVSKTQNHLLKAPFCIHPKTGKVCIPIDIEKVDLFDPFKVPTLRSLIDEIDGYDANKKEEKEEKMGSEIEKTSLQSSIQFFYKSFLRPVISSQR